jgi:hypothetical protein
MPDFEFLARGPGRGRFIVAVVFSTILCHNPGLSPPG